MNKIRNEKGEITTDNAEIQRIIRDYCEQLYGNKIDAVAAAKLLQSCPTLSDPMDCRLLCPWDFPGKSTVVGCHCLLR